MAGPWRVQQEELRYLLLAGSGRQHARQEAPHWSGTMIPTSSVGDPDPGFWWPKIEEEKKKLKIFLIFVIKTCNLLISRPLWRMSKLQENPSAIKREHPALQKWDLLTFSYFEGHFCPPGSGSGAPIEYGSIRATIESGSNQDPQHCLQDRGQGICIFWSKKYLRQFFYSCKFFQIFCHQNPASGSVLSLKCWFRIQKQWIRI